MTNLGLLKPIENVAQTIGSGILNDPQRHLTALSKRYQESGIECKKHILDNALIMQSTDSVDHPEWSTEAFDCIIKALSRI